MPTNGFNLYPSGPRSQTDARMNRILVVMTMGLLLARLASAQDTDGILDAWFKAQGRINTWQAEFTQIRTMKTLSHPLRSEGRVWFSSPSSFRWELGTPPRTIAVRDDREMWIVYPLLKRAERYALKGQEAGVLGEALGLLDAGFPRDRMSFDARFRVRSLTMTNGSWAIDLQPVKSSTRRLMPSIRVDLNTNTFMLVANEIVLPDGSRMRNEFHQVTVNRTVDVGLFKPTLGENFEISEPLSK